jgi:hypothetical protein
VFEGVALRVQLQGLVHLLVNPSLYICKPDASQEAFLQGLGAKGLMPLSSELEPVAPSHSSLFRRSEQQRHGRRPPGGVTLL